MHEEPGGLANAEVRWRTRAIGRALPFMVFACILLGFAAFDASIIDELVNVRRGHVFALTQGATVAGINIPIFLLALYLAWEVFRFAWRWVDQVAIEATPVGLFPHRSTLMKPLKWGEVSDLSYKTIRRAPSLVIKLCDGSTRTIRGVENETGAAEKFAAHAREKVFASEVSDTVADRGQSRQHLL
jgi:hypothetical protein